MATEKKKSKPRIGSALDMQRYLEKLFFSAMEAGDRKAAAYCAQIWISSEAYAREERKHLTPERTSLDDLCDILRTHREKLSEEEVDEE